MITIHTRQLKTSNNTHETNLNFTTCTKGKKTQKQESTVFSFHKFRTTVVPEDLHLQQYRCENLKCRSSTLMSVRNPSCVKSSVASQYDTLTDTWLHSFCLGLWWQVAVLILLLHTPLWCTQRGIFDSNCAVYCTSLYQASCPCLPVYG